MLDANKCWWISLLCSIALGIIHLYTSWTRKTRSGKGSKGIRKMKGVKRKLVSDCFDLFIPGHVTGYLPTSTATVGVASAVSTVLSSKDIWDRMG